MPTTDSRRFARTARAHDEISNRRKSLRGKLRTALFLVDPAKSLDALQQQFALIGAPADALAQLVAGGYVEEIGAAAGPAPAAAPGDTAAIDDEVASFRVAKAYMNDTIVDALGIRAFGFTLRLERCATRVDLAALLPAYAEALGKKLDGNVARALVERLRELLPPGPR
jgi:hypothetical protein